MEMDSETQEGDMPDKEGQYLSINDRSSVAVAVARRQAWDQSV